MAYGIPKDLETESAVSIHFRVKTLSYRLNREKSSIKPCLYRYTTFSSHYPSSKDWEALRYKT